jgi:hypothetical protein
MKSRLEFSVNAIIVLILVITLLVLGLTFIRGLFKTLATTHETETQEACVEFGDYIPTLFRGYNYSFYWENGVYLICSDENIDDWIKTLDNHYLRICNGTESGAWSCKSPPEVTRKFSFIFKPENVITSATFQTGNQTEKQSLCPPETIEREVRCDCCPENGIVLYGILLRVCNKPN